MYDLNLRNLNLNLKSVPGNSLFSLKNHKKTFKFWKRAPLYLQTVFEANGAKRTIKQPLEVPKSLWNQFDVHQAFPLLTLFHMRSGHPYSLWGRAIKVPKIWKKDNEGFGTPPPWGVLRILWSQDLGDSKEFSENLPWWSSRILRVS